jgi:HSP20 family molecular chaperone IbpA
MDTSLTATIEELRSDKGSEYVNEALKASLRREGILHITIPKDTPQYMLSERSIQNSL